MLIKIIVGTAVATIAKLAITFIFVVPRLWGIWLEFTNVDE